MKLIKILLKCIIYLKKIITCILRIHTELKEFWNICNLKNKKTKEKKSIAYANITYRII